MGDGCMLSFWNECNGMKGVIQVPTGKLSYRAASRITEFLTWEHQTIMTDPKEIDDAEKRAEHHMAAKKDLLERDITQQKKIYVQHSSNKLEDDIKNLEEQLKASKQQQFNATLKTIRLNRVLEMKDTLFLAVSMICERFCRQNNVKIFNFSLHTAAFLDWVQKLTQNEEYTFTS